MAQKYPEIGLRAVFELTGFTRNYSRYQAMMRDISRATRQTAQKVSAAGQGMATSFEELIQKSEVASGMFQSLPRAALDPVRKAFGNLSEGMGINAQKFDELVTSGTSLREAFQGAIQPLSDVADEAGEAGDEVVFLGRSFTVAAVAAGVFVAAIRLVARVVRASVGSYLELAEATRRIQYQTGLSAQAASGWVLAMKTQGVSAASSERALTSFLGKIADLNREQALGEDASNDFAIAIQRLGIDIQGSTGHLKSTQQLIREVNQAFVDIGPGAEAAARAQDLFGYSGRFLLPLLLDEELSLAGITEKAEELGATLSKVDKEDLNRHRKATIETTLANEAAKNEIARGYVPVLATLKQAYADALSAYVIYAREMRLGAQVYEEQAKDLNLFQKLLRGWTTNLRELGRAEAERIRVAEEAEGQLGRTEQAERDLAEAREDTLKQLDKLKTQYAQKLADIERDAQQRWDDILVGRQRDAMDRALQAAWRLDDLRAAYNDRMASIEADFAKRWNDIFVQRQRDAIERGIRLAWRLEDLARDLAKRRRDIEEDASRKREDLEREHQRKLRDIQQRFIDTAEEAARRNDAVAVARAQRVRNRAIRDEMQRYTDEREDFERSLQKRRDDIERDRRERERDLQRELERERILRELHYRWELEEFQKAKQEQKDAAEEWRKNQLAAMQKAHDREVILLQIQHRRQLEDFNRAQRRQLEDARRWYQRERDELAAHLDITGQQLEMAYRLWTNVAAAAAKRAAIEIANAWAAGAGWRAGQDILMGPPPTIGMAEGGVIQASSPTTVLMGEAGTETGIFLPGRAGSLNVNHNFGRMGVDFGGLPGGMNTQQIQALVYATMVQLAKGIQIPRS